MFHRLASQLEDFAAIGIREVWLISAEAGTVEALSLRGNTYARIGLFGAGDTVTSTVLDDLFLSVDRIFEE